MEAETGRGLWRSRVELSPDSPYIVCLSDRRSWTYGEADDELRRIAAGLASIGVEQGTRVLVAMRNRGEALLVHHALRELGAVTIPLVAGLPFPELAYQVDHSEAPFLLVEEPVASTLLPRIDELRAVRSVVATDALEVDADARPLSSLKDRPPLAERALPGYDDRSPWAILYTSGSTGKPKGVVLPAGAFVSAGEF